MEMKGVHQEDWIPIVKQRWQQGYSCEVAAKVAVQKANGLWVDDKALVVKTADFGKDRKEKSLIHCHSRKQIVQRPQQATDRTVKNLYMGQRSYVEVVKGGTNVREGSVTIKAEEIGNRWLC
ncbi:hypothetical protein ACSBR2_016383 [Camellia fascicularis]